MTSVDVVAPAVAIDGSNLPAATLDALVSMHVELGFCVVGRATLRFTDPGYKLSGGNKFRLGASIEVKVGSGTPAFTGKLTGVALEQNATEVPELVVIAHDAGIGLTRTNAAASYNQMTYSQVITKLAQTAQLTAKVSASGLDATMEYLLRTGTALAYLDVIAKRTGVVWYVQDKTLHVIDADKAKDTVALTLGEELLEWSVRASALRPTTAQVTGWDPDRQEQLLGTGSTGPLSDARFVSQYVGTHPDALGAAKAASADLRPMTTKEADLLAKAVVSEAAGTAVVARGRCFASPALRPGVKVKIDGAGPTQGSYVVSEVEHVYTERGFYTRFVAGPRRPTDLVDTLAATPPDPGFAVPGLVVGVVTNNVDPKNLGRVKVKFAALGNVESSWARIVALGAGADRGMVFQFEVNDEVLVAFEGGDTRRPVVLGSLFSAKWQMPEAKTLVGGDKKVKYRRIISRRGSVVEFDDDDSVDKRHILLKLGGRDHLLNLAGDSFALTLGSGIPMKIACGSNSIEITKAGDIEIKGQNIKLTAKQNVEISGMQVTVKGTAKTSLQAPDLEAKADGMATVQAGGVLQLKGGVVKIN